MKKSTYLMVLLLLSLSCNQNDDTPQNDEATLHGSWSLTHILGGLAGVNDDFETGLIVWDFNDNDHTINITNNNTSNVIHSGYPSGVYNYEVITTANDTTLIIENTELKITSLTTHHLIIDEGYISDGFQYTFSK